MGSQPSRLVDGTVSLLFIPLLASELCQRRERSPKGNMYSNSILGIRVS